MFTLSVLWLLNISWIKSDSFETVSTSLFWWILTFIVLISSIKIESFEMGRGLTEIFDVVPVKFLLFGLLVQSLWLVLWWPWRPQLLHTDCIFVNSVELNVLTESILVVVFVLKLSVSLKLNTFLSSDKNIRLIGF